MENSTHCYHMLSPKSLPQNPKECSQAVSSFPQGLPTSQNLSSCISAILSPLRFSSWPFPHTQALQTGYRSEWHHILVSRTESDGHTWLDRSSLGWRGLLCPGGNVNPWQFLWQLWRCRLYHHGEAVFMILPSHPIDFTSSKRGLFSHLPSWDVTRLFYMYLFYLYMCIYVNEKEYHVCTGSPGSKKRVSNGIELEL